jgi:hypothetical protein
MSHLWQATDLDELEPEPERLGVREHAIQRRRSTSGLD